MKHLNYTIIILLISLPLMAAQVPDDTAPAMKVKSRKLVFKADPKGLTGLLVCRTSQQNCWI